MNRYDWIQMSIHYTLLQYDDGVVRLRAEMTQVNDPVWPIDG